MFDVHVSDDSFAVWCEGTGLSTAAPSKIDIHINEWITKDLLASIDFGIRIYTVKLVDSVGFFIPYPIGKDDIEDLTRHLKNDKIARVIFNATCDVKSTDFGLVNLNYNEHESNIAPFPLPCKVYPIEVNDTLCVSGTKIIFDLSHLPKGKMRDEFYFRFRIPHNTLGELLKSKKVTYNSLTFLLASPIAKEDYTYLMRVNERRTLPHDIWTIPAVQNQKIEKVRVLLAFNGNLKVDPSSCYKLRRVEDSYKEYVPSGFQCDDAVVYHWLSEQNNRYHSFALFFRKENINFFSLLIYSLFVIFLSAVGGLPNIWSVFKTVALVVVGFVVFGLFVRLIEYLEQKI